MSDNDTPLRVAIDNDSPLVVAGLAAALRPHADRIQVVPLVRGDPPAEQADVVLFDTFGRKDVGRSIAELRGAVDAKVLVFSWARDVIQLRSARAAGAAGFVSKAASAEEIVAAIECAHEDKHPVHWDTGAENALNRWPGREEGLSIREAEVLALICACMSNLEIAEALYLSINSVKTYIRAAYRKIGVRRRSQAILWAVGHGFPSG